VRGLPAFILVVLAMVAFASVHALNAYWLHVVIVAMVYAMLTASWSLLAGYAGLFSLGHMAFASIGGYTSALLVMSTRIPIPAGILAGVALCFLVGGVIGWVCLRMSGPYLAIFTLAFAEIVRITFSTEDQITSGMAGLHTPPLFHGNSDLPYFYSAFGLLACSLAVMAFIVHSRWGLFFRALREDEQAAAASGVDVSRFRILAFAIASGFAGLAGGFYAHYIGVLTPADPGGLDVMAIIVVSTVIGGMERIPTAVGGAIAVELLLEFLRGSLFGVPVGQWRLPLFGAILLLTMRFARNGLLTPLWQWLMRLGNVEGAPPAQPAVGREGSSV